MRHSDCWLGSVFAKMPVNQSMDVMRGELERQQDGGAARGRVAFAMIVISMGAMLGPLDSAVNVAFPMITKHFNLQVSDIQWIVIVYVLCQSSLSVVFGKLGDIHGHRRIFALGCAACALIHLAAGFAPSYPALVALRGLQGLAIGIGMSCGPALATLLYPPEQKRRALAIYTMLFGAGLAIGPLLAGVLIERFGWPSVFWYRAPLALFAFCFVFVLPEGERPAAVSKSFDWAGAVLLFLTLTSFVITLSLLRHAMSMPFLLLLASTAFAIALYFFIQTEIRASDPVVHVRFYRNPSFAGIQAATLGVNFFAFGVFLLAPYLLVALPGVTLIQAGFLLALYPCGQICGGLLCSRMPKRFGSFLLVKSGLLISAGGLCAAGLAASFASPLWLSIAFIVAGMGLGIFQSGNLDLTTTILPPGARGVAGSLVNVARLLGIVTGAALITLLYDAMRVLAGGGLNVFAAVYLTLGAGLLLMTFILSLTALRAIKA